MKQIDISQLIGEATEYDKKQAIEERRPKSWCKSVSAFANGIGGKLVWGIADDASVGVSRSWNITPKRRQIWERKIAKRLRGNYLAIWGVVPLGLEPRTP